MTSTELCLHSYILTLTAASGQMTALNQSGTYQSWNNLKQWCNVARENFVWYARRANKCQVRFRLIGDEGDPHDADLPSETKN